MTAAQSLFHKTEGRTASAAQPLLRLFCLCGSGIRICGLSVAAGPVSADGHAAFAAQRTGKQRQIPVHRLSAEHLLDIPPLDHFDKGDGILILKRDCHVFVSNVSDKTAEIFLGGNYLDTDGGKYADTVAVPPLGHYILRKETEQPNDQIT